MERLATPWCFLGPAGSGKLRVARKWIEAAHGVSLSQPLEIRTFSVGDGYEAKVLASPYHFEIDIPNLSMQDKQIIGELLMMFLSSGDVLNSLRTSTRKLVILRRAHCLSLPAAIRVRAILQQYVLPANAAGMIWITAREMTGALSLLEDTFVRYSVPRIRVEDWCRNGELPDGTASLIPEVYRTKEAWLALEGRPERAKEMAKYFPKGSTVWPRRIQDFYDEMVEQMMLGISAGKEPTIDIVEWIRGRVYDALSFCQTGPEIVDSCAAAFARYMEQNPDTNPEFFWAVMNILAESEPHTSYRTPLALEWAMLNMYEAMRKKSKGKAKDGEREGGVGLVSTGETPTSIAPTVSTETYKPPRKRVTKKGTV